MRLFMVIISIQIMRVFSRRYVSSSDESIENLLYYKDCQHKPKSSTQPPILREEIIQPTPASRQPDCPFPKMCCSMSCGNDCVGPQSYFGRQMEPLQSFGPIQPFQTPQRPPQRPPQLPVQPQIMQRARKKRVKPTPSRRDATAGFTKEKIKSLISQDDDIRKILKDLVRVTMQKVDLLEMVNTRRNENQEPTKESADSEEY